MSFLWMNLYPAVELNDAQFYQICRSNRHLRIERAANGELLVSLPRNPSANMRNLNIWSQFYEWELKQGNQFQGISFCDANLFQLPNGAIRSPDAAWVRSESMRKVYGNLWEDIGDRQMEMIYCLVPDLVVEMRYPDGDWQYLQWKMQEYIANGVSLGWSIEVETQNVEVYRVGHKVEKLLSPHTLSGEYVMPGFELNLGKVLANEI